MNPSLLFNPAGGIRYHLRARRYSQRLWQPFRWSIGEFLLGFQPEVKTLLLVGPSGGYCLQPFLFERFERVVCLEPDPLARWLFRRKLEKAPLDRRPRLEFIAEDHLVRYPERLPKLTETLGDCALLFSNVLGQLRELLEISEKSDPNLERIRRAITEATHGRPFASFHDRVSGRLRPNFVQPFHCDHRLSDEALVAHLYKHSFGPGNTGENLLLDHLTEGLFPDELPHEYFLWPLEPRRYHVIEAVLSP